MFMNVYESDWYKFVKHQVVILSTADFDSAVWTNKQHLAVGLAADHDVVYVESLGLRQPTISVSDVRRVADKLVSRVMPRRRSGSTTQKEVPEGITVLTPVVVPFHRFAAVRLLNKKLLHRQMRKVLAGAESSTLWTFSPLTYGLEKKFGRVVYHSVDLLHTLPRVPGSLLLRSERELMHGADHVIASSGGVRDHLMSAGASEVLLWQNVAHVEAFMAKTGRPRRNRAVFAGNLTPAKIDLKCLESILDAGMELAIAGPIDIDGSGSSREISALLQNPLVTYHGNLALPELAELLAASKIGLIPYQVNEYTQGVFPMKVYEYLAAGLSVVSTALPSLASERIRNLTLTEPGDFGTRAGELIAGHNDAAVAASMATAESHSWTARIRQATDLLTTPKG